jgi:hypothetical protein
MQLWCVDVIEPVYDAQGTICSLFSEEMRFSGESMHGAALSKLQLT